MICVGIYAVLITGVAFTSDITGSLWSVMGFTVLLAFTLFKTGSHKIHIACTLRRAAMKKYNIIYDPPWARGRSKRMEGRRKYLSHEY